jgi:hypothetical protein
VCQPDAGPSGGRISECEEELGVIGGAVTDNLDMEREAGGRSSWCSLGGRGGGSRRDSHRGYLRDGSKGDTEACLLVIIKSTLNIYQEQAELKRTAPEQAEAYVGTGLLTARFSG